MQELWNKFGNNFFKNKIGTLEVRYKMEISNYMVRRRSRRKNHFRNIYDNRFLVELYYMGDYWVCRELYR